MEGTLLHRVPLSLWTVHHGIGMSFLILLVSRSTLSSYKDRYVIHIIHIVSFQIARLPGRVGT
jgi:hypothetical protein